MKQPPLTVHLAISDKLFLAVVLAFMLYMLKRLERVGHSSPHVRRAKDAVIERVRARLPDVEARTNERYAESFARRQAKVFDYFTDLEDIQEIKREQQ